MNVDDLVSVIIPVYKVEQYIEECVVSVINQTYPRLEIILVDDCGGDASIKIAENILKKSSREWKILSHDRNRGLSATRNTGVNAATGKFFYFLDSDDYISNKTISVLVDAIRFHKAHIVFGNGITKLYEDGTTSQIKDNAENLHEMDAFEAFLHEDSFVMACHRLIDRRAYLSTGIKFREGIVHEDDIWSFQLSRSSLKVCSAPGQSFYYYRQRKGSIMDADPFSEKRYNGALEVLRNFYQVGISEGLLYNNGNFILRYCKEFNRVVSSIMSCRSQTFRYRMLRMKKLMQEFSFFPKEQKSTYLFMKVWYRLAYFMPARLAYHIAVKLIRR